MTKESDRRTMEVGLSLGSNIGDRLDHLQTAVAQLQECGPIALLAKSPVYETEPVDVTPRFRKNAFLNAVVLVRTDHSLPDLSACIHSIEDRMGRKRGPDRNAPRSIDIDILYADNVLRTDTLLQVPHPRWSERRFVVQPLADVRPNMILPGEHRSVREVLLSLPENPKVVLFARRW